MFEHYSVEINSMPVTDGPHILAMSSQIAACLSHISSNAAIDDSVAVVFRGWNGRSLQHIKTISVAVPAGLTIRKGRMVTRDFSNVAKSVCSQAERAANT